MTKKPEAYPLRYVEDFFRRLQRSCSRTIEMRNRKSFFTTLLVGELFRSSADVRPRRKNGGLPLIGVFAPLTTSHEVEQDIEEGRLFPQ